MGIISLRLVYRERRRRVNGFCSFSSCRKPNFSLTCVEFACSECVCLKLQFSFASVLVSKVFLTTFGVASVICRI